MIKLAELLRSENGCARATAGVKRRVRERNRRSLSVELLETRNLLATVGIPKGDVVIELETVATGLTAPVGLTHAGDRSGRLFVTDQAGQIRIIDDGNLLSTPFLDISNRLPSLNAFFDERGLLGLAFHPNYGNNGRFFVRYSAPREGDPSEPCFGTSRGCHSEVLSEFHVSQDDPNVADPDSELVLFSVAEPQFNHNAGDIAFGPDNNLYFTLGDGGGANDGLADTPPSHGPIGNGQNIETTLGSMLRINVDRFNVCHKGETIQVSVNAVDAHLRHGDTLGGCGGSAPIYTIPNSNPFVGKSGADEIFAYGFRNPYKFSFDDGKGGDRSLYVADVGQALFEEVSIVERGGNYGWVIKEGTHCFDPFNPRNPPATCGDTGPNGEPLIDPIVEYSHPGSGFAPEGGITVIGGFVYRGSESPSLQGKYIFGDFAQRFTLPSGSLYFVDDPRGADPEIQQFRITTADQPYGLFLKGFGEDENGEIYALGSTALAPRGTTGVVQRIVAVDNDDDAHGPSAARLAIFGQIADDLFTSNDPATGDADSEDTRVAAERQSPLPTQDAPRIPAGSGSAAPTRVFEVQADDVPEWVTNPLDEDLLDVLASLPTAL